jgi:hypothetical protein
MSYQKLNPNRAWTVTPSDFAPLPVYMSEVFTQPLTEDFFFSNLVVSQTTNFVALGVSRGDVVVGTTSGSSATVTEAISQFGTYQLVLNGEAPFAFSEPYTIYKGNNRGALLYIGVQGDVRVLTAGNDDVTFTGLQAGAFIPVNVIQVFETGTSAENILALY